MKQKTNGKIVVAVLAMFAIAISIIGFTYAYFTASFNENNFDKSVVVKAGKLTANFVGTNAIDVRNVVPGWKSDGLSYYDAAYAQLNNGNIFALHLEPGGSAEQYYGEDVTQDVKATFESNGLTAPIQFKVENSSDSPDAVSFYIRLVDIKNGIKDAAAAITDEQIQGLRTQNTPESIAQADALVAKRAGLLADDENLWVHLYSGKYEYDKTNYNGTLISSFVLGDTDVPQTLTARASSTALSTPHTIAKNGEPLDFFVIFEYKNVNTLQYAQLIEISAKVEIVGVQESSDTKATPEDDAIWYNEDGVKLELPVYTAS